MRRQQLENYNHSYLFLPAPLLSEAGVLANANQEATSEVSAELVGHMATLNDFMRKTIHIIPF